jgi:hypothetical protein
MSEGWFTGKTLADYFPLGAQATHDWIGAREIVNGKDHAAEIAAYALHFSSALASTASSRSGSAGAGGASGGAGETVAAGAGAETVWPPRASPELLKSADEHCLAYEAGLARSAARRGFALKLRQLQPALLSARQLPSVTDARRRSWRVDGELRECTFWSWRRRRVDREKPRSPAISRWKR